MRVRTAAGNITAGDAGSFLTAVGLSKSTSEFPPPLYNPLALPSGVGRFNWPGGAIGVVEALSGKDDPGAAGVISAPAGVATVPIKIIAVVPGTTTSDTAGSASPISAEASSASGSNELWVGPSPIAVELNAFELEAVRNTPALASVGATIQTAKQAGGYSLLSQPSAGSVAAPASGNLFIQPSSGVLTVAGGSGQTFITSSALGFGGLVPVDGFFRTNSAVPASQAVAINLGDPTIQESPAPLAVAAPGAFLLTPLVTATTTSYAKTATNGASSLGAAANLSNVATAVGISTVSLALSGPSKVSGNANGFPAMDRTLTLTERGVAQVPPFRDISKPGNQCPVVTTQADLPRIVAEANALGLAIPSPQRSDLIMDFMPFDQAAVGQTIDRFLQQLEDLGAGLSWLQGPMDVLVELLAVAVALTTWKLVPKILGHSRDDDDLGALDDATSLEGISGLPGGSIPEEP